jgi:hypothetical protein
MSAFYVYAYFRPNGTPCYIGKGKGHRWLHHMRFTSNKHLASLICRYGELPVVKIREGLTDGEAIDVEVALIAAIGRKANGGPLVNQTNGGDGASGWKHTPDIIDRMRHRVFTEEQRRRRSKNTIAQLASPEARAKLSADRQGNQFAVGNKSNTGRVFSAEHRERIRLGALRRWASP